jgi:four helix bundle protein
MPTILRFEDMEVWQTSRELTHQIYAITRNELVGRDFGLCNQMHSASVSIMSNIAEGFESRTNILFTEFLRLAKASAGELRAQVYVAKDVSNIDEKKFKQLIGLCEKISKQISRFIRYLEQQPNSIREEGIEYNV